MKRLALLLSFLLWPSLAFAQARIDQLGAAAAVGDTNVVPICQGCSGAVNAVGATGTQLTSYFATKFFSIANNLSEVSGSLTNKASSRSNLGIPAGTSTTLYHGCTPNCDPTFSALATGDISASAVTYAKIQNVTASKLLGNSTGSAAAPAEIGLAARLAFAAGNLDVASGSITNTQLSATAASDNLGAPTHDLSGPSYLAPIVAKVNGVAYPTTPNATDYVPITTSTTAASYEQIPNCGFTGYSTSSHSFTCPTQPNLSLSAGNPGIALSANPTSITSGNVTVSVNFPIQTTAKTASYELVDSHSGGATDAFTTIKFNGSNLIAGINSSSASYFPSGYAVVLLNENASALTVCIGSTTACTLGGSSTFDGPGGTGLTSFTLGQWCWAWIQADGAASPNNYNVQSGCYGSSGAAAGAVTKINTQTASNSATLDFTGLTTTYHHITFDCTEIVPVTNLVAFQARVGTGATTWQTASYEWRTDESSTATTTFSATNSTNDAQITMSSGNITNSTAFAGNAHFIIDLFSPDTAGFAYMLFKGEFFNGSDVFRETGSGWFYGAATVTGIRFYVSSGNISTGQCTAYGWQK